MTTYYVDPAATGEDDGTSWTDAWASVQTAFDTATAGDIVYCRGTQTLAAQIDIDTRNGSISAGHIKFIGCNAAGNNDGTRFVLDGNSAAGRCLYGHSDYLWIENFECKNATGEGIYVAIAAGYGQVFINCSSHDNEYGFSALSTCLLTACFIRCVAFNNSKAGFYLQGSPRNRFFFCRSRNNANAGFDLGNSNTAQCTFFGCVADHNGTDGFFAGASNNFINCIADANVSDGFTFASSNCANNVLIGCRSTNHSGAGDIGLNAYDLLQTIGWSYFENNDGDNLQNAGLAQRILYNGTDTVIEDQGDTNQGYTDTGDPEDYNLRSDATLRRVAITIPES